MRRRVVWMGVAGAAVRGVPTAAIVRAADPKPDPSSSVATVERRDLVRSEQLDGVDYADCQTGIHWDPGTRPPVLPQRRREKALLLQGAQAFDGGVVVGEAAAERVPAVPARDEKQEIGLGG